MIMFKVQNSLRFQVTGVIMDTRASIDLNTLDTQSILEELSNIS